MNIHRFWAVLRVEVDLLSLQFVYFNEAYMGMPDSSIVIGNLLVRGTDRRFGDSNKTSG